MVGERNQRLSLQHGAGNSSPLLLLAPQPFPTLLKCLIPSMGMDGPQALPEHPSVAGWVLSWSSVEAQSLPQGWRWQRALEGLS